MRARSTAAALHALLAASAISAQVQPPNAADLYEQAFAELRAAMRLHTQDAVRFEPLGLGDAAALRQSPWPELLAKTAVARGLFAQAARTERCVFGEARMSPRVSHVKWWTELGTMRGLIRSQAYGRLADDADAAVVAAETLLAHGRHFAQQDKVLSSSLAMATAKDALELLEATLQQHTGEKISPASLQRAQRALRRYQAVRPTPQRLFDQMVADARSALSSALAPDEGGQDPTRAALDRAVEIVAEVYAPVRTADADDIGESIGATEKRLEALKAKTHRRTAAAKRAAGQREVVATVMAASVCSGASYLLDAWAKHHRTLTRVQAQLRARAARPPQEEAPRADAPRRRGGGR